MTDPGLGGRDFDFIHGRWRVQNRKLRDAADPTCDEWVRFEATSEAVPVLRGVGHVDRMDFPTPTDGGPPFEGLTLRLFDPAAATWTIWWSSSRYPGRLDAPMVGRFRDGRGEFDGEDVVGGRPVSLRFTWTADPEQPRWEQSFSFDGGATWRSNWVMEFARVG